MHITFNTIVCIYTIHFTLTDFELIDNIAPQLCSLLDMFKEKRCGPKCTLELSALDAGGPIPKTPQGQKNAT